MVFTTQIFLFVYFPICMICYYIADRLCRLKKIGRFLDRLRFKDLILIAFSLGFYMWSCFDNVFRLLLYVIVVYILALWIAHTKSRGYFIRQENNSTDQSDREQRKLHLHVFPLIISVALVIFCLIYFNYTDFLIACWNSVFGDSIPSKSLVAPLGLSFITFSAVSYLTDIYRGDAKTGSFIDCLLYLTFFPKMISGPIVLWKNFANQIKTRRLTLELSIEGIHRIMIGFAKKVILADTFGACLAKIQLTGIDQMTAFGTLVLYMLQIYYDFFGIFRYRPGAIQVVWV